MWYFIAKSLFYYVSFQLVRLFHNLFHCWSIISFLMLSLKTSEDLVFMVNTLFSFLLRSIKVFP